MRRGSCGEGRRQKHGTLVDQFEIAFQRLEIGVPIFRHDEQIRIDRFAHMADPVTEEPGRDVFCGVQAEAINLHLLGEPAAPIFEFLVNRPVPELDIRTHQIVEIAVFLIDFLIPFPIAIFVDEAENAVFGRLLDMVDTAEALQVPYEFGMFAVATGKVKRV